MTDHRIGTREGGWPRAASCSRPRRNTHARPTSSRAGAGSCRRCRSRRSTTTDDKREAEGTLALERNLTAVTDRVIACSQAAGDHVAGLLGIPDGRLTVVPNAVDAASFAAGDRAAARAALGIEGDRPAIALVGRIDEQKGQDDFVRAAPLVRAAHPDAVLLLGSTAKDDVAAPVRGLIAAEGGDAAAMGAAGRERARAFSWERSTAILASTYDDVLAAR